MNNEIKNDAAAQVPTNVEGYEDLLLAARGAAGVCLLMAEYLVDAQPLLSDTLSMLHALLEFVADSAEGDPDEEAGHSSYSD